MRNVLLAAALTAFSGPALANDTISAELVEKIEAFLTSIECQMDPADIEAEENGYELDDVICKGGDQFDITLDKDLNEVARRAE